MRDDFGQRKIRRTAMLLSSFLVLVHHVNAQQTISDFQLIYDRPFHYSLGARQSITQKDEVRNVSGSVVLQTRPNHGQEYGIQVWYNAHRRVALTAGLSIGFIRTSYYFEADLEAIYEDSLIFGGLNEWGGNEGIYSPVTSFSFGVAGRQKLNKRFMAILHYRLVLSIYQQGLYSSNFGVKTETGQEYQLGLLTLNNSQSGPNMSHLISLGFHALLPNKKLVECCILLNLANKSPIGGSYDLLTDTPFVSSGDYLVRLSYIGLEVSYIFTRVKKKHVRSVEP